jgi:PTH2 family peptidyl-tRNA hydrolase
MVSKYLPPFLSTPKMIEAFWMCLSIALVIYITISELRKRRKNKNRKITKGEEYVLNIIIRTDLGMSKGKVVSQVGHAITGILTYLIENRRIYDVWKNCGEPKIALKGNIGEINDVVTKAREKGVHVYRVYDAGKTQVPSGSNTVVAIGPAPKSTMSLLTGNLKLY